MSNDTKQQPQPAKPRPPDASGREPIPVGVIYMYKPSNLPGADAGMSLKARKVGDKEWTIERLPWQREFRVSYTRAGERPIVRHFLEHAVESWDPPEQP